MSQKINPDIVGFSASILCAIHCALFPFLLTITPLASFKFLESHMLENSLIVFSLIVACYALIHGYKKHHKNPTALLIVIAGFLNIFTAHFTQTQRAEIALTTVGAILIALSHAINWFHIKAHTFKINRSGHLH